MNAYRNYNNNTSAISKNLEKLSSGYKINRAGDDAAGLAVSQKMRLQIAGLEQAQKNAKSGISYIQTAEGALQEVHEMLERMYTLTEQSANGTFDSDTDRVQLQKEVNNLLEEIDRIGKTANFNGMGIFAEYAGAGANGTFTAAETMPTGVSAVKAADLTKLEDGDVQVKVDDVSASGATQASFEVTLDSAKTNGIEDGKTYNLKIGTTTIESAAVSGSGASNAVEAGDLGTAFNGKEITLDGVKYTISATAGSDKLTFKAAAGKVTALANDTAVTLSKGTTSAPTSDPTKGSFKTANKSDGEAEVKAGKKVTITNGEKTDSVNFETADWKDTVTVSSTELGISFKYDTTKNGLSATAATIGTFEAPEEPEDDEENKPKGEITFWVGAEYSEDNKLTLKAMNLSHSKMTIASDPAEAGFKDPGTVDEGSLTNLDITDAETAMGWLEKIKTASNAVSDMRGTLGAMQNRLDHTIKNLSVMQENMQDAESVIRDTDVAEEMMAYTKNNILVQSAQAMLAQANQIPQGVLQLLG